MLIKRFPEPPMWMKTFSNGLKNNSYVKYFMIPVTFFGPNDKDDDAKQTWNLFCRCTERSLIIGFILSFILNGAK